MAQKYGNNRKYKSANIELRAANSYIFKFNSYPISTENIMLTNDSVSNSIELNFDSKYNDEWITIKAGEVLSIEGHFEELTVKSQSVDAEARLLVLGI